MIDCERLNKAIGLAKRYREETEEKISLEFRFNCDKELVTYCLILEESEFFHDLDLLIHRLEVLNELRGKYEPNQKVWVESYMGPIEEVRIIDFNPYTMNYQVVYSSFDCKFIYHEQELFPSKAELIAARLSYWTNLQNNMIKDASCPELYCTKQ